MRVLFFILSVLIPLPLFINVLTGELIIQHSYDYSASYGAPVPVGIFATFIIGVLSLVANLFGTNRLRSSNLKLLVMCVSISILFFIYSLKSLELMRAISITVPFGLMIFLFLYCNDNAYFQYSIKGYLLGLILFISAHSVSNIKSVINDEYIGLGLLTDFYGFEIYQSLVSYSAVLSYMGCIFVLLCLREKNNFRCLGYFVIIPIIYYLVAFGARKAVLLDIVILLIATIVVTFWYALTTGRIIIKHILGISIALSMISAYILMYSSFVDYRELSFTYSLIQRWPMVLAFIDLLNDSTITEILFGKTQVSWAGYSNFFISLTLNLGLLGMLVYILTFILWVKLLVRNNISHLFNQIRTDFTFKTWSIFAVISLIMANTINMNFQLPYYMLNFVFLSLMFMNKISKVTLSSNVNRHAVSII